MPSIPASVPAGGDWEVSLPGKMLQVSGDCEDNKNVPAFIDGREYIESDLSVQKVPAVLLFDLLHSILGHTLETMLVGKVNTFFLHRCGF